MTNSVDVLREIASTWHTTAVSQGDQLLWTIGRDQDPFPDLFVVRSKSTLTGKLTDLVLVAPTVDEARKFLPRDLARIDVSPENHPNIVEAWL